MADPKIATPDDRAKAERDARQVVVADWVRRSFGEATMHAPDERAARLLEETVEFGQALGLTANVAHRVVDYVYGRPPGDPAQEAGGVGVTLLCLCEAIGISADEAEASEIARVLAKPVEHFQRRQAEKRAAGLTPAIRSGDDTKTDA